MGHGDTGWATPPLGRCRSFLRRFRPSVKHATVDRRSLVLALHDSPIRAVIAVTGGGVALLPDLLNVPGASRTVIEATVPYAEAALARFVGSVVDGAVRPATAEAMARAGLARAQELEPAASEPLVGLGVTAALATDRPKKGEHRAALAVVSSTGAMRTAMVVLDKGRRTRDEEDRLVADLALALLAGVAGLDEVSTAPLLAGIGPGDVLTISPEQPSA